MEGRNSYKDIFELLRSEILSGKYSLSCKFPSSTALARRFKTSRFVIRQSLDLLRQEGLIVTQKGCGTFVSKQGRSRLIGLVIPGISYSSDRAVFAKFTAVDSEGRTHTLVDYAHACRANPDADQFEVFIPLSELVYHNSVFRNGREATIRCGDKGR